MKSKIILVLAVIMGLVTTVLFYKYMNRIDEAAIVHVNTVDVVAASKTIQRNERITEDMLVKANVPKLGLHTQTVLDPAEIVGKYAISEIAAGETILSHRVMGEKEEAHLVSRKVKEGYRAISVGVNFVQSVSNLIEPEDEVDVIFSEAEKVTGEITTVLLFKKVRVLAVGRRMLESKPEDPYMEYSSATLELKEQDAVKLVHADERGNIQLILHSRISPQGGDEANAQ